MKTKIVKPYEDHARLQIETEGPSLTDQSCKDECDINYVIESYVRRGIIPPQAQTYLDCTTVQDYETAMMLVAECKSNFETLPVQLREEFKTVENYLAYVSDEANLKDCLDKGLIDKSSVPEEKLNEIYKEVSSSTVDTPLPVTVNAGNNDVSPVNGDVSANS